MTLLWCIAILAPSFFSIKMLARSSRHCEYPDQSRGSHFTMLTPRENLDVDSEDSEPAPHRHSGFRVVAEGGLQLSQFLTRISNKRSSEIRVYSFQSRKPLPMTTDGWPSFEDVNTNLVRRFGQSRRRRLEILPCEERRQGRCQGLQSLLHQAYFLMGIFRQLWDRPSSTRSSHSTTLRRGEQSPHQVGELGAGPRHSMRGWLPHDRAIFPFGSASKGARPALLWLWVADPWRSRFTAVPRLENEGFQNFHSQFIGRYNYSWTTFWTTASCVFVYNYMWQPYSWTFSFTIACGNITVGLRFERRLPAFPFTNACGHAVLLSGMSRFSRKPSRELLWKADSGGH